MKKHTQIAKLITAFFVGVLVMTFVSSAIAADPGDVIPNFTAMKIGAVSDPSDGGIRASGLIQADGAIKTARLVPTAASIAVLGSLDVADDFTANSVGYFYTVSEYCNDEASSITNCDAYSYDASWNQLEATCETDDTIVMCEGWPMGNDDVASYYSWADDNGCFTMSDAPGIQTQAICFSPDGEPTTGLTASTVAIKGANIPASFSSSVESTMSTYITDEFPELLDLDSAIEQYIQLSIEDTLLDKGFITNTTLDDYIDVYNFATQSYVNTKVFK